MLMEEQEEDVADKVEQPINEKAIFMGNLVTDMKISLMKNKLVELLNSITPSSPVRKNHINVVCKLQNAYAFIFLDNSEEATSLIEAFNSALSADTSYAKEITAPGCKIKCGHMYKKSVKHKHKMTPSKVNHTTKSNKTLSSADDSIQSLLLKLDSNLKSVYTESKSESYLVPRPNTDQHTSPGSGPKDKFPMHKLFYKTGEIVGAETRFLEFKQGRGTYMDKQLREHVAKYTCGFLNSEGGTLLIGIRDTGLVEGVSCDHGQEDQYRLQIDSVIKMINPTIFSHMYEVFFAPVLDKSCNTLKNIRVIEISVVAGESDRLYETPEGHVYMRRDGSLQGPLHARHIQEWTRCKILQEHKQRELEIKATLNNEDLKDTSSDMNDNKFWQEEILKYRQREEILQAHVEKYRYEEEVLKRQLSAVTREREKLTNESRKPANSKVCVLL